eukprot:gnl/TRDRNA2_/TRDRNA2_167348_c0_seq1.p2 gnl/TRDRNA2_/TRDRNA2_167348_c0~~gnl/TRDRNA2_/TRDRNA2_167348_c0_seq1.p2  ORF type:complete len:145 (+),score=14.35 gnl/TRDRNA2_/TRDRNA2_167348_c0_seq1:182-616(+)
MSETTSEHIFVVGRTFTICWANFPQHQSERSAQATCFLWHFHSAESCAPPLKLHNLTYKSPALTFMYIRIDVNSQQIAIGLCAVFYVMPAVDAKNKTVAKQCATLPKIKGDARSRMQSYMRHLPLNGELMLPNSVSGGRPLPRE